MRGISRVWLLNLAIAAGAAALLVGPVERLRRNRRPRAAVVAAGGGRRRDRALAGAPRVPAQRALVLAHRRSRHARAAVLRRSGGRAAIAAGSVVALAFRRLPPLKFVFNLSQFVFTMALGYVIVHLIAGAAPDFGPSVWAGVFVALQSAASSRSS